MNHEGHATNIPSQVICLPPPLLTPSLGWAAVQPSPDRTSVLVRGRHECQLVRLTSSNELAWHHQRVATQERDARLAENRMVLLQPHRTLTASCWVSAGAGDANTQQQSQRRSGNPADRTEEASALGAVVALGDDQSTVSVLRATHHNPDGSVEWVQSTMFLHDEQSRLFTTTAAATAATSNASLKSCCCSATWTAVETIIPCQQEYSFFHGDPLGQHHNGGATDGYLFCQRRGEGRYGGGGDGAARASARVTTHRLWMAAVAREAAWAVPLSMPDDDEDNDDVAADAASINSGVRAMRTPEGKSTTAGVKKPVGGSDGVRRGVRIFDVRRRAPSAVEEGAAMPQDEPPAHRHRRRPFTAAGGGVAGPTAGRVFAAASHRHVGLFSTTTVTPTVFFNLPDRFNARCDLPSPMTAGFSRWAVTSVLEAPPSSLAASPAVQESPYAYLITVSRVGPAAAHWSTIGEDRWWMLYDCRKPSAPVWAAEAPTCSPAWQPNTANVSSSHVTRTTASSDEACAGVVSTSSFDDASTEWLCPAAPTAVSAAALVCASYVPCAGAGEVMQAPMGRPSSTRSSCGVCVVMTGGGATAPSNRGLEQIGQESGHKRSRTDVQGPRVTVDEEAMGASDAAAAAAATAAAPIMYELAPPPSLASICIGQGCRVRALSYSDDVLTYWCTRR
ncbi:hypothetical protein ABB37_04232 [Leptomonas pyrrhocoris]|uniref:Uncharacterized protein n=1 Tax=Leptomonas pyrrhocoris TaxID=157538 RepID=A0A0M9G2C7_LEPPY|nr:hypothetical protein ABB37_04232 [Leptomonas pyrrhocoris]XP_015659226.1 hypothetical protein ABB37_04232 [Leptomonas pyrrhocoris]KPA80786.1 hypothetical protein ABB37_04232 [Leptomonas pyrrhocoris]KPA80787.1 hypothetical protein ABB37_04232 [Leptomonas pyrrhocoris]|eukprot:XP_015659225.1 hypothetical protein ABB37_04232 [Leptomonas pyrrhocoris]